MTADKTQSADTTKGTVVPAPQSPNKLRIFKNFWPGRDENENSSAEPFSRSPSADASSNVDNEDKSRKRGFFTMRTRKKEFINRTENEMMKESQLDDMNLPTSDDYKFKDAYRINMSPLSKSEILNDSDSGFGFSDSEISADIIAITPDRDIASNDDSIQMSGEINLDSTENNVNLSKGSNSVCTLVNGANKSPVVSFYVGDLDKKVTEVDLHSFFSQCPGLISVKIPRDSLSGESLGYGYVNIENMELADVAIEKLNYTKLGSSEVRIMPSIRDKDQREKTGTNVFISHLPPNLTTRQLYDKFKKFGEIMSCKYSSEKGTCFINYEDKLDAFKVCKLFNKSEMDGHTILASIHILKKDRLTFQKTKNPFKMDLLPSAHLAKEDQHTVDTKAQGEPLNVNFKITKIDTASATPISSPKPADTRVNTQYSVFIRNLPMFIKDDVIKGLVEQFGKVTSVLSRKVPSKQGAWALVTMTNREDVEKAVNGINLLEVEGKQLFVTRAIPREQKSYARRYENFPRRKRKILVSGLDMSLQRSQLEQWCSQYTSIKSVEMYGTSQGGNNNGYGYIEINSEEDAADLMNKLKSLGISCYNVMIEMPNADVNFEAQKYPYMMQPPKLPSFFETSRMSPPISFSYVDPTKMYQIADLNNKILFDKYSELNRRESYVKQKIVKGEYEEEETVNKINEIIWELAVRMFTPIRAKTGVKSVNPTEVINQTKVSSLTHHMIKFCWAKNVEEFYQFLKLNQCDSTGNIILPPHPLIERQMVQSAMYLGIIPKQ